MSRVAWLVVFSVVLVLPYALRPSRRQVAAADKLTLVIVSPHTEEIRFEFEAAFDEYYQKRFGRGVDVDWRNIGGTSEISRYLASEYGRVFGDCYRRRNGQAPPAGFRRPDREVLEDQANWQAFNIGVDLFFGGGQFDHEMAMRAGYTAPATVAPEVLAGIPHELAGIPVYDKGGHWYGAALSGFGIVYNRAVLRMPWVDLPEPRTWRDLTDPGYAGLVGLADPRMSGSATKGFEMILQAEMTRWPKDPERGWREGMKVIQQLSANARYFTDGSSKIPLDVAARNSAAGMAIDFYGKFQAEYVGGREIVYVNAEGGTVITADPISMLRGAPHRELAERFIEFVLSEAGQMLWDLPAGFKDEARGMRGPLKYNTRRIPVRPDIFERYGQHLKDPENPFETARGGLQYRPEWTGPLFGLLRAYVGAMCVDTHDDLRLAWRAARAAQPGQRERLEEIMFRQAIGYEDARLLVAKPERAKRMNVPENKQHLVGQFREKNPRKRLRLRESWAEHFRGQYRRVQREAEEARP